MHREERGLPRAAQAKRRGSTEGRRPCPGARTSVTVPQKIISGDRGHKRLSLGSLSWEGHRAISGVVSTEDLCPLLCVGDSSAKAEPSCPVLAPGKPQPEAQTTRLSPLHQRALTACFLVSLLFPGSNSF